MPRLTFNPEIGHFEFCDAADPNTLNCLTPGIQDRTSGLDADDTICVSPGGPFLSGPPFIQVGGCLNTEDDFDGTPYGLNWAGTFANVHQDQQLHPQAIQFTSPLFFDEQGRLRNFNRVAFETDVPGFEPGCDLVTGAGCVLPAAGMQFYPFYTAGSNSDDGGCHWQLGGGKIPGTVNDFGGSSTTAYGNVFFNLFQTGPNTAQEFVGVFRRGLNENPCPTDIGELIETLSQQ